MKRFLALAAAAAIGLAAPGVTAQITYTLSGGFSGIFSDGTSIGLYSTVGTVTAIGDTATAVGNTVTLSSFTFQTLDDTYVPLGAGVFTVDQINQVASFVGSYGTLSFSSADFATYSPVDPFVETVVDPAVVVATFESATTSFNVFDAGGRPALTFAAALDTPPAVPEPATWAMMVGGFGLVGGALRRRKPIVRFA